MQTSQKFKRRRYGNRPFKNYDSYDRSVVSKAIPRVVVTLPWYKRLLKWFLSLIW